MNTETHPYFVPDSTMGSRKQTAILLVGTATEHKIDQREVFAVPSGGFRISENVYKALGWDDDDTDDTVGGADARQSPGSPVGQGQDVPGNLGHDDGTIGDVTISSEGFAGTLLNEDQVDAGDVSPALDSSGEPVGQSVEDVTDAIDDEVPPYAEWEYADLRTEAARRDLDTPDLKAATLIAALEAYDASIEDDEQAETDDLAAR